METKHLDKDDWIRLIAQIVFILFFCISLYYIMASQKDKQCGQVYQAYNDCVSKYSNYCLNNGIIVQTQPLLNYTFNETQIRGG